MSVPVQSLFRACQLKLEAIPAAIFPGGVRPALYFDEAPQTDSGGSQVQPTAQGYAVLKHKGNRSRAYAYGLPTREDHDVEVTFFYPSLSDCQTAAIAARLGGGTTAQRVGFDYGTLPDLGAPYKLLAIRPRGDAAEKAGMGKTGVPVHSWRLSYRVELVESL